MRVWPTVAVTLLLLMGSLAAVRAEDAAGSAIIKLGEAKLSEDNCTIVLSSTASKCEAHAAEELKKYVHRISGVDLPIKTDDEKITNHMILVGNSKKLKGLGIMIDFADLGEEGFVIRTSGDHLVLAGGRERGTLYSVYTLLEEFLGCGWFMPAGPLGEVVPSGGTFSLAGIDRTEKPSFEWRAMSGITGFDWQVKNKLDPSSIGSRFGQEKGDPAVFASRGHNFDWLVPPKKHFLSHPEYFALVNGKREWDCAQICTSNADVIRICAAAISKQMDDRPDCKIFEVCQDDGRGWCECEKCKALDVEEDVMTDRLLKFVNAVASRVYEKHPDKYVHTFAYHIAQDPPKTKGLKPAKNLIIEITHYSPCCHSHPVVTCEKNAKFKWQIETWAKLCHTLYVYDYRVDYTNYLMPYANCYAIAKDIPYYKRLGGRGLFYQGGSTFNHGLCHYLIAKLAWNSEADVDALIDRFFQRYFGKAGPPMKAYFRMLHDKMWDENICVHLYSNPPAELFTPELLKKADAYYDEAERLADDDRLILDRVQRERLTLYYVKLATGRSAKAIKNRTGCYHGDPSSREDTWREDLAQFIRITEKYEVRYLQEDLPQGEIHRFVEKVSGMTVHDKAEFRYLATSDAHSGKKCAYMRGGCPGKHPGWRQGRNILQPKTTYNFRAWIKVRDIKNVKVETLRVRPAVNCQGPTIEKTQDWTLVETTFTTPDVPSPTVTLYPALLSNEGEVSIDDVSLTKADAPEKNLVANPGFERTLWIGAKKWHFPYSRNFSWTKFAPIKDFLEDPKGYTWKTEMPEK